MANCEVIPYAMFSSTSTSIVTKGDTMEHGLGAPTVLYCMMHTESLFLFQYTKAEIAAIL